jgi:hypothetical protein
MAENRAHGLFVPWIAAGAEMFRRREARTIDVSIICTAASWPPANALMSLAQTPARRQRTKRFYQVVYGPQRTSHRTVRWYCKMNQSYVERCGL